MAGKTKMRAKLKDGTVSVKALMSHIMETGLRKDKKTGEKIPAHYINKVTVNKGDTTLMTAHWSGSISKNPMLSFEYAGAAGDQLTLNWTDNKGETGSAEATVK
jgi:sulfur-oxidizing protein SoxZ